MPDELEMPKLRAQARRRLAPPSGIGSACAPMGVVTVPVTSFGVAVARGLRASYPSLENRQAGMIF